MASSLARVALDFPNPASFADVGGSGAIPIVGVLAGAHYRHAAAELECAPSSMQC